MSSRFRRVKVKIARGIGVSEVPVADGDKIMLCTRNQRSGWDQTQAFIAACPRNKHTCSPSPPASTESSTSQQGHSEDQVLNTWPLRPFSMQTMSCWRCLPQEVGSCQPALARRGRLVSPQLLVTRESQEEQMLSSHGEQERQLAGSSAVW